MLERYTCGSPDSKDCDVMVVVESIPTIEETKKLIEQYKMEYQPLYDKPLDIHLITIEDGIVTDCSHGTIDEINNMLIDTYHLHKQEFELLVTRRVPRDFKLKFARALRGILSFYSKVPHLRPIIKPALKGTIGDRLNAIKYLDLKKEFPNGRNMDTKDVYKVIAFQIAQTLALSYGVELYTKQDVSEEFPLLESYMKRSFFELSSLQRHLYYLNEDITLTDEILSYIESKR